MTVEFDYQVRTEGLTIEELLREKWQLGKKMVHELRMASAVTGADGEPIGWTQGLKAGDVLRLRIADPASSYTPDHGSLTIAYQDEHCLVVHKPAGMAVHPNEPGGTGTLMNRVMAESLAAGRSYAEHVHRLDQGTSGLVLIARHPVAKAVFDRMLEKKEIRRVYFSETDKRFQKPRGRIDAPIGRDRHHATRRRVSPSGQPAVTHYEVLREENGRSLVRLELDTGRTHQIRVHMASTGHPIVGDALYGGRLTEGGGYRLHAGQMAFIQPFTGEELVIDDPQEPGWLEKWARGD